MSSNDDYVSPAQASVLAAMRSGHKLMSAPGVGFWLTNAAMQGVSHSAAALIRKGFIEPATDGVGFGRMYQFTEKARKLK